MRTELIATALVLSFAACSSNPDPEYDPDFEPAPPATVAEPADVQPTTPAAPAQPAAEAQMSEAAADPLPEAETMRLGREVAQLLFDNEAEAVWPRLDDQVQAQLGSLESFAEMTGQIWAQLGTETEMLDEQVITPPADPTLSVYRRSSRYSIVGGADLLIVFRPDRSIAGLNIQPNGQ